MRTARDPIVHQHFTQGHIIVKGESGLIGARSFSSVML